jgi:serine/threonine-protein kinase
MEQEGSATQHVTGYEIGDLLVDLGRQSVTRSGSEIPFPRLSFDLLVTLAQAAPNFVSFDELTARVWPGLVIAPETISQRVKLVRDALGDEPHAPRYIAGVRGRGYRMVAVVKPLPEHSQSETASPGVDAGSESASSRRYVRPAPVSAPVERRFDRFIIGTVAVLAAGLAYVVVDRFWISKPVVSVQYPAASHDGATVSVVAFNPPPHSIAVLPFVNMSGDASQDYFADGLAEELLNDLARINELQVAARTSAFSFKGKDTDIGTIARKLNVGAVLEGSVRRSANTIRVTAQLNNATTGFHLWSQTYDRDSGDVLHLQTEIATAVAEALKVTLLGDVSARIELGGTRNPAAFDAYLRASKALQSRHTAKDIRVAIAAYTEAIRLDPDYGLAFAGRSSALSVNSGEMAPGPEMSKGYAAAEADARHAIALAPELGEAHAALALVMTWGNLDFARARDEYERALALAPGNAQVLRQSGSFAASTGRFDAGIAAIRRAVVLDPLDRRGYSALAYALHAARRYRESATAYSEVMDLAPDFKDSYGLRGLALYELGDLDGARASCELIRDDWGSQQCLAIVYDRLGRHADGESELAKMTASIGGDAAYQYAEIYAQWGDRAKALEWLDKAMHLRDPGLIDLKTDPLLDPVRHEPRFYAMERALNFPE